MSTLHPSLHGNRIFERQFSYLSTSYAIRPLVRGKAEQKKKDVPLPAVWPSLVTRKLHLWITI